MKKISWIISLFLFAFLLRSEAKAWSFHITPEVGYATTSFLNNKSSTMVGSINVYMPITSNIHFGVGTSYYEIDAGNTNNLISALINNIIMNNTDKVKFNHIMYKYFYFFPSFKSYF